MQKSPALDCLSVSKGATEKQMEGKRLSGGGGKTIGVESVPPTHSHQKKQVPELAFLSYYLLKLDLICYITWLNVYLGP